jgi:hypothetical protein
LYPLCNLTEFPPIFKAENLSNDITKNGSLAFDAREDPFLLDQKGGEDGVGDNVVTAKLVSQDSGNDLTSGNHVREDNDHEHDHDHEHDGEGHDHRSHANSSKCFEIVLELCHN